MKFHNYFSLTVRTLGSKGRRNLLKIITLALGISAGVVLATKVCFEQTFDDYHSDADRIVYLSEYVENNGVSDIYPQTSGGIAPFMKEHYPEVEEATRSTFFESGASLIDSESSRRYSAGTVQLADSCFFKVFDRECLAGNLTSSLGVSGNAVVSSKIAVAMAESRNVASAAREVIGRKFTIGSRGTDVVLTVAGVFEEFPANSSSRPDVVLALPVIGKFMYDGTDNVLGNDRYQSYLKLRKGVAVEDLNAKMDSFVQTYLPVDEMREANFWMMFKARPLTDMHLESADIRNTNLVLGIVAFVLLLVSVLNYLLIVISTCITRSREMALRKCLGGGLEETAKMMFAEALVHTLAATLLASGLLLSCRDIVENYLGLSLSDLFSGRPLLLAVMIILAVFCLNGFVPTRLFAAVPVATAFRNYSENRRKWKFWLLVVEFTLVAFLTVLISIISVQYNSMANANLGFSYEDSIELATPEADAGQHKVLIEALRAMPEVEDACFAFQSVFPEFSGNNIRLQGQNEDLFGAQDLYYVDDHWLNVMGIELKEGRNFNPELPSDDEVIVDTYFADKLKSTTGWDEVVGKQVCITEHGDNVTIIGIIDHISLGHFSKAADQYYSRPIMVFFSNPDNPVGRYHYPFQYVRCREFNASTYERIRQIAQNSLPGQAIYTNPFRTAIADGLRDTLQTRNSILVGGIITLLIAIAGLIGYTIDEIKRRAREIAIRRISGAEFTSIRRMFFADTICIAIPSAIIGCIFGSIVATRWEHNFTYQVGVPWWVITLAVLFTVGMVTCTADIFVRKTADTNPVESIKTE